MSDPTDVQNSIERMKIHMELRGHRPMTVHTFNGYARRFLAHVGKAPAAVTAADVESFVLDLCRCLGISNRLYSASGNPRRSHAVQVFRRRIPQHAQGKADSTVRRHRRPFRCPVKLILHSPLSLSSSPTAKCSTSSASRTNKAIQVEVPKITPRHNAGPPTVLELGRETTRNSGKHFLRKWVNDLKFPRLLAPDQCVSR